MKRVADLATLTVRDYRALIRILRDTECTDDAIEKIATDFLTWRANRLRATLLETQVSV
jgi:hypothetical protein